jgi:hypothetical protein
MDEGMYPEEIELAGADATDKYKTYLIDSLIELTQISENVMVNMLQGRADWQVTNAYISRLVHLAIHLYPKLIGSGDKAKDLLEKFNEFKPWFFDPTIPLNSPEEGNRIPELFLLIREAYERFNLTPL